MKPHRNLVLGASLLLLALASAPAVTSLSVRAPGTWTTDNAQWGMPPVDHDLLALHTDTNAPLPVITHDTYGKADVSMPEGTQIEDIGPLSYDYYYETGSCGGGSPRFQLRVDLDGDFVADKNVFVYAGPFPNYNGCPQGVWVHDQLDLSQPRFDASQVGGSFYNNQAQAQAAAGPHHQVLSVSFVWDSDWLFGPSSMWWDNLHVNTYTLDEPAGQGCVAGLAHGGVQLCAGVEVHT